MAQWHKGRYKPTPSQCAHAQDKVEGLGNSLEQDPQATCSGPAAPVEGRVRLSRRAPQFRVPSADTDAGQHTGWGWARGARQQAHDSQLPPRSLSGRLFPTDATTMALT